MLGVFWEEGRKSSLGSWLSLLREDGQDLSGWTWSWGKGIAFERRLGGGKLWTMCGE